LTFGQLCVIIVYDLENEINWKGYPGMTTDHETRLNAYSRPTADGVTVDVELMMLDLITVLKASGVPLRPLLEKIADLYTEVEVEINIPNSKKN
jgi:hypothetical protein